MKKKTKILISGGYGNGNAGDEALLYCLLKQIREAIPKAELHIFSDIVSYSKKYFPEEVFIYSGRYGLLNPTKKGLKKLSWIPVLIKEIIWCDTLVTGGGTIFQDQTNSFFIPFWVSKIFLAKIFFKKNFLYGVGLGKITTRIGNFFTRLAFRLTNDATLRGKKTAATLGKIGVSNKKFIIAADPAVLLNFQEEYKKHSSKSAQLKIAVSIRQWYKIHKDDLQEKKWVEDGKKKYQNMVLSFAKTTEHLVSKNIEVNFFPMSIEEPNDDRVAILDVISSMKGADSNLINIYSDSQHPVDIKKWLSQMDILIGMRLHSLIFFSDFCRPMVGVAYGDKTFDFLNTLDIEQSAISIDDITPEKLMIKTEQAIKNLSNKQFLKELEKNVVLQKQNARKSPKRLKRLLYK